jgi:hypothetical protein
VTADVPAAVGRATWVAGRLLDNLPAGCSTKPPAKATDFSVVPERQQAVLGNGQKAAGDWLKQQKS